MKFGRGTTDSVTGKPYYFVSQCGRYTVGIPFHVEHYVAWLASRNVPDQKRTIPAQCLGWFPSAKEAKEACEHHARTD